jgi:hypothetical protein
MRVVGSIVIVSFVVLGMVVGLGEAAQAIDRAGTVSFDTDACRPVGATALPFEDRAA